MIQTDEFEITNNEYFKILLIHHLRSYWWLWIAFKVASEVPMHSVFKTVNLPGYWLLYVTRGSFVIVPKSSFKSHADLEKFEAIVKKIT